MRAATDEAAGIQRLDSDKRSRSALEKSTGPAVLDEPQRESLNIVNQVDVPPDGGYGWVCTACVFLINAHTWGINSVRSTRGQPSGFG